MSSCQPLQIRYRDAVPHLRCPHKQHLSHIWPSTTQLLWADFDLIVEHKVPPHAQALVHMLLSAVQTGVMMKDSYGKPPGSLATQICCMQSVLDCPGREPSVILQTLAANPYCAWCVSADHLKKQLFWGSCLLLLSYLPLILHVFSNRPGAWRWNQTFWILF